MYSYEERIIHLLTLEKLVKENKDDILEVLEKDLGKSKNQSNATEIDFVLSEIKYHLRNLYKFIKPKTIKHFGLAKYYTVDYPYKNALIISPWNYPIYLSIMPLIGALSAGVSITLKPSEIAVHTQDLLKKLFDEYFDKDVVKVVLGGKEVTQTLIDQNFDVIFFTGSSLVGKSIVSQASKYLSKVILELGGKSPVIVTKSADIKKMVQKVVWAKTINSGQTCIAPDYLLVEASRYDEVINKLTEIDKTQTYQIINEQHYQRLNSYLDCNAIISGGTLNDANKSMGLTIINKQIDEEIFGPILPVIKYESEEELLELLSLYPNPLATYVFGSKKEDLKILDKFNFGSACVNDVLLQLYPHNVAFGGVKESGHGCYHGIYSYKAFVHEKTVFKTFAKFDFNYRYKKTK